MPPALTAFTVFSVSRTRDGSNMNLYFTNPGMMSPPAEISRRRIRNVVVATLVSPAALVLVFSSTTNQPCISRPGVKLAPGLSLPTVSFLGPSGGGAGGGVGAGAAALSAGGCAGAVGGWSAGVAGDGAGCALAVAANAAMEKDRIASRCMAQTYTARGDGLVTQPLQISAASDRRDVIRYRPGITPSHRRH